MSHIAEEIFVNSVNPEILFKPFLLQDFQDLQDCFTVPQVEYRFLIVHNSNAYPYVHRQPAQQFTRMLR